MYGSKPSVTKLCCELAYTYKARNLCLSVCGSHISRTVHPNFFTLGRLVAEDPTKCSVKSGTIWTCNTFTMNTFQINSEHLSVQQQGVASAL